MGVKGKMRALNMKAADMVQELNTFFRPIESYLNLADIDDLNNCATRTGGRYSWSL
jgi:hypothetical protein